MQLLKLNYCANILCVVLLLFTSCTKEPIVTYEETTETELNFKDYKIDLSEPYTDLSSDQRFKSLTSKQVLAILEYYSPGTTNNTSKQNCNNCVYHVRGIDGRLMPSDSGCNVYYKWTNTGCLKGKMKLINSCTPKVGSAVIMDTGIPEGHVAYIESVANIYGTWLKINEGNRPAGVCRTIWISADDAMIKGYQDPNKNINCSNEPFYACASPYNNC